MFQTVHLECYQQRSFTLKMYQNRWLTALPIAGLRGPTSEGRGREGRGGERRGGEGLWTLTMLLTD